eukprot:TRINITY_DN2350_c0_g1_i14.p1 TRINITY_DN2350_c0_g1~~TRINITY_DN2350_c0_g1_i14.p1  ORF type:complete len:309 (-),score=51.47 TRINITY_DN2350_c0_g1_i14:40-966(-)
MDIQSKRKEVQRQQEQWMRERAAQFARKETQFIGSQNEAKSTEEMIDKVTSHLIVKIKYEVMEEMKRDNNGQKFEGFLAAEIESHTCPICYELMVAPVHAPILFYPCGHTFCKVCVGRHRQSYQKDMCPCCRVKISAQAPNISLQQLIQNYIIKKDVSEGQQYNDIDNTLDQNLGFMNDNQVMNQDDKIHHVRREMQMKAMRARVMETELSSLQEQKMVIKEEKINTQKQFKEASLKVQHIDEQIGKLQLQRREYQLEKTSVSEKLGKFEKQTSEVEERSALIYSILQQLKEELSLLQVVQDECQMQN